MKIIDTTTFFEENLMMDIRFNILNSYVDKFIVCESIYSHSGKKKKINFNLNDYPKFKDKIKHIILETEPKNLIKKKNLSLIEKRKNSILRINHQRNYIMENLNNFSDEDILIYSDNDEIPNLDNINFNEIKQKIIIFNQKIFYYKLNLLLPSINWFGSKACKIKYISSINNLRDTKNKKYSKFRIDTWLSKIKFNSIKIIKNGGWHFSNLKDVYQLQKKYLNDENHAEYEKQGFNIKNIKDSVEKKYINYNHSEKKNSPNRFNKTKLVLAELNILPSYIKDNLEKYKEWIEH